MCYNIRKTYERGIIAVTGNITLFDKDGNKLNIIHLYQNFGFLGRLPKMLFSN
jgi:hypothetical protein